MGGCGHRAKSKNHSAVFQYSVLHGGREEHMRRESNNAPLKEKWPSERSSPSVSALEAKLKKFRMDGRNIGKYFSVSVLLSARLLPGMGIGE